MIHYYFMALLTMDNRLSVLCQRMMADINQLVVRFANDCEFNGIPLLTSTLGNEVHSSHLT